MKCFESMKQGMAGIERPWRLIVCLTVLSVLCAIYPSDFGPLGYEPEDPHPAAMIVAMDHYGRFFNTALQVALPLLLRDPAGMVELVYVGASTTIATQGLKRLVNDWHVDGTRLGQRPAGLHSNHNMPSGHSSMSSCAVYFVGRRYGLRFVWVMLPIMLLTMQARVALGAHTVSAALCGAFLGFLMAAIFTSRYVPGSPHGAARRGAA